MLLLLRVVLLISGSHNSLISISNKITAFKKNVFTVYAIMIISATAILIVIMIMQQLPLTNEMNVKCRSFNDISRWILHDES